MTRLLVLGGSAFVGRALVEDGLAQDAEVTVFNRGAKPALPGVIQLIGDRETGRLDALRDGEWDVVVDTWSGAPAAVAATAALLSGRVGTYVYISSGSVYVFPSPAGSDETAEVVPGDPNAADVPEYPSAKRGGELSALTFDGPTVLARAGLILGPWSNVGRLRWWLERIARGGDVLAPGPPDLGIQFIDNRDLARWCVDAGLRGLDGPYNLVRPVGDATMADLLSACIAATGSTAVLRWVDPEVILQAGIQPWTDLPVWLPPGELHSSMHCVDVSAAMGDGLQIRSVQATVADTWSWLRTVGPPDQRADLRHGLAPDTEREFLARL